jgi:hypothetical protein
MGEPFVVTKQEEAEGAAGRFLNYISSPVLTQIRLEYEGFSAYDVEPSALPDMFAQRPILAFGKWHGAAQGVITVTGRTAGGPFREQIDVSKAIESPWGGALRFLWARHRIQRLADFAGYRNLYAARAAAQTDSKNTHIEEVTQLGLKYNLLTPYTSFVAVDQVVRGTEPPEKVQQPLAMPEGVRDAAVGEFPLVSSTLLSTAQISVATGNLLLESSSSVGIVLQRINPLEDIPLIGDRSWQELMLLAPGATLPVSSGVEPLLSHVGNGPHPDGQSRLGNSYKVNSVETGWGAAGAPFLIPSANAVEEVRGYKGPFDANLGHEIGAVVLKSGSNTLHGSAFAFGNGDATSASDYFSHMRPNTRFAQMGVDMGAPIIKNKLFFFSSYQHTVDDRGRVFRLVLPTEAFRRGDFGAANTIVYDPASGNGDGSGRQPFAGNRIPTERISPIARNILSLLPQVKPGAAPGQVNYESSGLRTSRTQSLDTKLDWNVDSSDRFSVGMSLARPITSVPSLLADFGGPINAGMSGNARQLAASSNLNYTRSWTPTLLVEANVGWSQYNARAMAPIPYSAQASSLGIPGIFSNGLAAGVPSVGIDGYSAPLIGFDGSLPGDRHISLLQADVMIQKFWGRHDFHAGVDIRRRRESMFGGIGDAGPRGAYQFSALQTADAADISSQSGIANALAGFLLDAPNAISRNLPAGTFGTRRNELALFAYDEWKVADRISVSLGWRYEYHAAPVGLDERGGLTDYEPAINTLRIAGYGAIPSNLGVQAYHHWLPRASASWQLTHKTTVRGGYGIQALSPVEGWYAASFPRMQNDQIDKAGVFRSAGSMASGLPSGITESVPASGLLPANSPGLLTQSYFAVPRKMVEGRMRTWNIGVLQNLPLDLAIDARYVGSRGSDIPALLDLNAGLLPGAGDAGRPLFSAFGRRASTLTWWASRTEYDAFQTSFENRGGKLWFKASYTLGRACDYASENGRITTPADLEKSWGRSDYDRRHAFTTAFSLQSGDHIGSSGWLRDALKDWRLSGYFIAQSGTPVDITASNGLLNAPGNIQRPDRIASAAILGAAGPGQLYFDTSVFSMPRAASWGNIRRNSTVDGPGIARMDMAISRDVGVGGEARIQLRVECFNITNSPQFVNPSGDFGSPTFGQVTATVPGSERSMRFGARFSF